MTPEELKNRLKGPIPLVITPFRDDYSVDYDGLRTNVNFLIHNGMKVLAPLGSSGEFAALTQDEHREVMRTVVEAADGRATVLVGASHSGTKVTLDLVKYAEMIGADGVLVRTPYYWCDDEGRYLHYKSIAENCKIGISIYNCNLPPDSFITLSLLERLFEFRNIVAMKEAGPGGIDFYCKALSAVGNRISILGGGTFRHYLSGYLFGSPGYIDIMGTFAPQISIQFFGYLEKGEIEQAKTIILNYENPYLELASSIGGAAALLRTMKATMNLVGLPAGPMRLPLRPFPENKLGELKRLLKRLGV
jgi:4-hydroxy-tetrahydrodipicolinate synthase